jgi:hypothetical protein
MGRNSLRSFAGLTVCLALAAVAALRFGIVPPRLNPLAPLSLAEPAPWFLDYRLAALKHDLAACNGVLRPPIIRALATEVKPVKNGCGWNNAVSISSAGGARVAIGTLSCEMAAALAMWLEHEVQPAAKAQFNQRVASIQHMGSYACRNVVGNGMWRAHRSQHARANALDISGFVLEDGQTVQIVKNWKGDTPQSRFLRETHRRSCRYFRAALSPDYNAAHQNHFHLDRGPYTSCR